MKPLHTHPLESFNAIKHHALITPDELENRQAETMAKIAQLNDQRKIRSIHPWRAYTAWALCAAIISAVIILYDPNESTSPRSEGTEQKAITTSAAPASSEMTSPSLTAVAATSPNTPNEVASEETRTDTEAMWNDLSLEEMEIYLIDEQEF